MLKLRFVLFCAALLASFPCHAQFVIVDQLLYSGRPDDPRITVTNSTSPSISDLLTFLQNLPPTDAVDFPGLGPRGYQLENNGVPGFPQEVRVFQGVIRIFSNGILLYFQDVNGLESFLNSIFGTADPAIESQPFLAPATTADPGLPLSGGEPPYNPNPWNDGDGVQDNNNCYNYAANKMTGTFAQPGRASGNIYTAFACNNVLAAAIRDGLIPWVANVPCPSDKYKVALVVWPGVGGDFHWYRQDNNGNWSHKPGQDRATNLDNAGNAITDPRTANRGPYVNFCAFMCVRSNPAAVNIASLLPAYAQEFLSYVVP